MSPERRCFRSTMVLRIGDNTDDSLEYAMIGYNPTSIQDGTDTGTQANRLSVTS